ncbi:MAG: hypothetical protein NWE92_03930 [Candidatus Bathyarchaeota archaeon]|nr:hypothetical protein [Candidatus Bathyarchaeota archaeon]
MQQLIFQTSTAQTTQSTPATKLAFNLPDIDGLFPGFKAGDFAAIYGTQTVTSLVSQLCIRAQLPKQQGGLDNKVVFIDAASSSALSSILEAAGQQRIEAKAALSNIKIARAYTAYRLTSLIMEELEEAVEASDAKLVVISDIVNPFLNDNVDDQEAKAVYSQIMGYLAAFARRQKVIVIATYLPHDSNRRDSILQEITSAKANTVLRFTKTPYTSEVELEKHPSYMLGVAEFTPEVKTLVDFGVGIVEEPVTLSYRML